MKRIAALFISFIYLISTSGVCWSQFYCCGKLKATYIFNHKDYSKDCRKDKKTRGCCETKTFFAKVKDTHSPASQVKISGQDIGKILNPVSSSIYIFNRESRQTTSVASVHSPPWLSKQPVYLSVCNFRI